MENMKFMYAVSFKRVCVIFFSLQLFIGNFYASCCCCDLFFKNGNVNDGSEENKSTKLNDDIVNKSSSHEGKNNNLCDLNKYLNLNKLNDNSFLFNFVTELLSEYIENNVKNENYFICPIGIKYAICSMLNLLKENEISELKEKIKPFMGFVEKGRTIGEKKVYNFENMFFINDIYKKGNYIFNGKDKEFIKYKDRERRVKEFIGNFIDKCSVGNHVTGKNKEIGYKPSETADWVMDIINILCFKYQFKSEQFVKYENIDFDISQCDLSKNFKKEGLENCEKGEIKVIIRNNNKQLYENFIDSYNKDKEYRFLCINNATTYDCGDFYAIKFSETIGKEIFYFYFIIPTNNEGIQSFTLSRFYDLLNNVKTNNIKGEGVCKNKECKNKECDCSNYIIAYRDFEAKSNIDVKNIISSFQLEGIESLGCEEKRLLQILSGNSFDSNLDTESKLLVSSFKQDNVLKVTDKIKLLSITSSTIDNECYCGPDKEVSYSFFPICKELCFCITKNDEDVIAYSIIKNFKQSCKKKKNKQSCKNGKIYDFDPKNMINE